MGGFDPFLGDPRLLSRVLSARARGSLVNTRALYLRGRHGDGMVAELAGRISPAARDLLTRRQERDAWLPIGSLIEIDRAIFEGPMGGDLREMRRFGQEIATFELPIYQRILLRLAGRPGLVVSRLPETYAQYLSPVVTRVTSTEGALEVELIEGCLPYYLCEAGCAGWTEAALAVTGASDCAVTQVRCQHRGDASCAYRLSWR